METRIAIIGIIIEDASTTGRVNELLHGCGEFIIGRMGIPYREKNISIISVVIDAEPDVINQVSGRLGRLSGASVKTVCSKK